MNVNGLFTQDALVGWVLIVLVFFLARYFLCWFLKINQIIHLLRSIEKNTKQAIDPVKIPVSSVNKLIDGLLPANAASRLKAAMDRKE